MDRTYFEDEFLLPHTKSLDIKLSKIDAESNPAGVLGKFFSSIHVGGMEGHDDGEVDPHVYYVFSKKRSPFILHQAMGKYRDEMSYRPAEPREEAKERSKNRALVLSGEFGGELKMHHTNNKKLRKIDVGSFVTEVKTAISLLRRHLEEKQEKRKRGIGLLIRSKYAKGRAES